MKTRDIFQDLNRNLLGRSRSAANFFKLFLTARYRSVLFFRVAQWFGSRHLGVLADVTKQLNQMVTGADLAWQADVGAGMILYHPVGVVLGPDCSIGKNSTIQQGVTIGGRGDGGGPVVGDDVFFGAGAKILGALEIGSSVMIGANAVVVKDVPAGQTAVGVPARWSRE